jgi:glycosyltransferase involved in cell wall biosynthesis
MVKVLYLAHCTHEKGLFDALEGVRLANLEFSAKGVPLRARLLVAGTFVIEGEKKRFDALLAQPGHEGLCEYFGFASGDLKSRLLSEADLFAFPTYYQNENQPVNLIEAMAFGLPILTTRWRSIPELFPENYCGLVPVRQPAAVARAILEVMESETGHGFRKTFLRNFTIQSHLEELAKAILSVETEQPTPVFPEFATSA